jgi:valyl-tRNA synthetase
MRYDLEDVSGWLEIARTHPETMFGAIAVAVNPEDSRYQAFIGKNVILPIINKNSCIS